MRHTGGFFVLIALLAGCTTTEVYTYERVADAKVDAAYIAPDADFSKYRRLYGRSLEIYYEDGTEAPTSVELQQLRAIFRNAFLSAVAEDYSIVYEPAPDALGVRASLVKLQTEAYIDQLPMEGKLRSLVAVGELTFLMELSDSMSGEVLARAADKQKPEYANVGDVDDEGGLVRAEAAAKYWAALFRDFLDRRLGR